MLRRKKLGKTRTLLRDLGLRMELYTGKTNLFFLEVFADPCFDWAGTLLVIQ